MLNKIVFLIFFFFIAVQGSIFSQDYWQKLYYSPYAGNLNGFDICESHGDYIAAGLADRPSGGYDLYVIKIDYLGNILWNRTVNKGSLQPGLTSLKMISNSDGSCTIAFSVDTDSMRICKISALGEDVWSRRYGRLSSVSSIEKNKEGGYIISGINAVEYSYVLKIDSAGNELWIKNISGGYLKFINSIISLTDSGYMAAGTTLGDISDTLHGFSIRFDKEGNTLWERIYRLGKYDSRINVIKKYGNCYIMAGGSETDDVGSYVGPMLMRTDTSGNVLDTAFYYSNKDESIKDLEVKENNIFAVTYMGYSIDSNYSSLIGYDTALSIVNVKRLYAKSLELRQIAYTSNGAILCAGSKSYNNRKNFIVIRTNQFFEMTPSGILNQFEPVDNYELRQNYPNPFNPFTTISYRLPAVSYVRLSVYDAAGNLVKLIVSEKQKPGNYSALFDGGGLASGVYFYKLEAGTFTVSRKMILLK